jgi:protein-tyrosine kinase
MRQSRRIMLIPKASHLIERVTERLLRSGGLDASTAQLLRQPAVHPTADAAFERTPDPVTGSAEPASAAPSERSSLFAAPPQAAVMTPVLASAPALPAGPKAPPSSSGLDPSVAGNDGPEIKRLPPTVFSDFGSPLSDGGALEPPEVLASAEGHAALAMPASLEQPRPLDRPADVAPIQTRSSQTGRAQTGPSQTGASQKAGAVDPAASLLQGPVSVDAVSLERAGMVDWSRTRTRISEEFRLVQRQILRSAFGPGAEPGFSNLLLVTSARPGEGKSFMSTNLAGSIARQGDHHVLLVDADSKRDSICYSLGLAQARGLLDLAANPKLDPTPLIVRTPIERLSILPVGRERERSAELFSTKEMTRLIQSLGRRYADRLLILDAPPCLSTSDPAVLAQVVGQIMFVVEADRTQRDEIEASLDLIQACPTITMVLNKQQISSRYTFGAYSSYYSS